MNKKYLAFAAVGLLAFAGAVIAQVAPQVQSINSSTDLVQIVPGGAPSAQSVYANVGRLTASQGYYRSVPTTNFFFTFSGDQHIAAFDPAGTLGTGSVTLAANPGNGLEQCVFSTTAVTALTVNANTGATINDAVTTLAANAKVCYLYAASLSAWIRTQ
jgi:hypothetical protein